jgi:hypothetical protein
MYSCFIWTTARLNISKTILRIINLLLGMNVRILIKNPIPKLKKKILYLFDIIYIYFTNAVPAVLDVRCSLSVERCPCEKENVITKIENKKF